MTIKKTSANLNDDIETLKEKVVELEESMMETAETTKKDAKEYLQEKYAKAKDLYEDIQASARQYAGQNLLKSLGIALVLGLGIGKLL